MPREAQTIEAPETQEQEAPEQEAADERRLRHYEEIQDLNTKLLTAYNQWLTNKEETSALRKTYEGLANQLHRMISAGPDMQLRLPGLEDAPQDAEDGWRDVLIAEALKLPSRPANALYGAAIETLGQLEDLRGGDGLKSIKGLGQAGAAQIEEQILDWFQAHRQEEAETETDEEDGDE